MQSLHELDDREVRCDSMRRHHPDGPYHWLKGSAPRRQSSGLQREDRWIHQEIVISKRLAITFLIKVLTHSQIDVDPASGIAKDVQRKVVKPKDIVDHQPRPWTKPEGRVIVSSNRFNLKVQREIVEGLLTSVSKTLRRTRSSSSSWPTASSRQSE